MLILGGALVVGYTYLYGVERLAAQVLMTAALAALIAMILFVILAMDYPFTGDDRVTPDPIVEVLPVADAVYCCPGADVTQPRWTLCSRRTWTGSRRITGDARPGAVTA